MKDDIHDYKNRLDRLVERIKESENILDSNKLPLLKFVNYCKSNGLQPATIVKDLAALIHISRFLNKPFEKADLDDIAKVAARIEEQKWSHSTRRNTKIALKKFYKQLRGTEEYPEEVRWIRAPRKSTENNLPDILTEEEVLKLVKVANNPRDKALVFALYESGCRVGEFLPLRIKNLHFDENGVSINVTGKTGPRRILLLASAPLIAQWFDNHPLKEDGEAYLWIAKNNRLLGYAGVNKILNTLATKAGVKKRIYPHLFRHSRITHLAKRLTESQLKQLFGWTQASSMAAIYVHLSGRDVDNALLELHGLSNPKTNEPKIKLKNCPRCQERNSPDATYCNRCAFPLDAEAMDVENRVMNELTQNPRASRYLRRMIREVIVKRR